MKKKKFDTVQFMRMARDKLAQELSRMPEKEQIEFLRRKYGHLAKRKHSQPA